MFRHPRPPNPRPQAPRPLPKPVPKPRPATGFAYPGTPSPAQYPAARPVIDPIPLGPVRSPLAIVVSSSPDFRFSLPRHGDSAPRASHLHARHAALMRLAMSALRTDARWGDSDRHGVSHAAASLAALTVSCTPTSATRHGKNFAIQIAVQPSPNDLAQFACHERDHLDSVGGDQPVHRPGNSAANQGANTQIHQSKCLLGGKVFRQCFLNLADNLTRLCVDDVDLVRSVEDRRDSIDPAGECRFHRLRCAHRSH